MSVAAVVAIVRMWCLASAGKPDDPDPSGFYNPDAFVPNEPFTLGDAGKNILVSPWTIGWDFSLFRNTRISEKYSVPVPGRGVQLPEPSQLPVPERTGRESKLRRDLRRTRPADHAARRQVRVLAIESQTGTPPRAPRPPVSTHRCGNAASKPELTKLRVDTSAWRACPVSAELLAATSHEHLFFGIPLNLSRSIDLQ